MKKLYFVFVLAIVTIIGFGGRADAATVWGMKAPIQEYVLGQLADHTYSCIGNTSNCFTFPAGSNKSGGSQVVTGTVSDRLTQRAIDHANCCTNTMRYGVDGVCHQHTNQVLQYAGTQLNTSVRGYALSSWYFGPLGYCNRCAI